MTQEYYNKNAKEFIENTINVDLKEQYELFEKYLPEKGNILDIGFGSGRDSLYFSQKYNVVSIDNCMEFIKEGKKILNNEILFMDVKKMKFSNEFNGIWACASLLHLPYKELENVLNSCFKALKNNGVMYMSFKYGDYEGIRNGRYFTDFNEDKLNKLLAKTSFKLIETKVSIDSRPDRDKKWLNVIITK